MNFQKLIQKIPRSGRDVGKEENTPCHAFPAFTDIFIFSHFYKLQSVSVFLSLFICCAMKAALSNHSKCYQPLFVIIFQKSNLQMINCAHTFYFATKN